LRLGHPFRWGKEIVSWKEKRGAGETDQDDVRARAKGKEVSRGEGCNKVGGCSFGKKKYCEAAG